MLASVERSYVPQLRASEAHQPSRVVEARTNRWAHGAFALLAFANASVAPSTAFASLLLGGLRVRGDLTVSLADAHFSHLRTGSVLSTCALRLVIPVQIIRYVLPREAAACSLKGFPGPRKS